MKKRRILFLVIIIAILLIAGYMENKYYPKDIIRSAELTKDEEDMIRSVADQYFVFDFNSSKTYDEAIIRIEKYQFGEKCDNDIEMSAGSIRGKGRIVVVLEKLNSDSEKGINKFLCRLVINSDGCISSFVTEEEFVLSDFASLYKSYSEGLPIKQGEITLGAICNSTNMNMGLSDEFFIDVEKNIDEIKDYDLVYLLKCELVGER